MSIKPLKAVSVLFVVLLLVSACAGGDDSASETTAAAADAEMGGQVAGGADTPAAEPGDDADRAADTLGSGGVDGAVLQTATLGRDIIFTANMTVAVTDVATAGSEATRIIREIGGYLFGQETQGAPEPYSVLTFKVLPGDFQIALERLGSVGEIRSQSVTADDVTERVVDLESRIATAAASVERLNGFLAEASDIESIAELEAQLLLRETDLETMRGQLRTLRDRVDLATIYLTLTEALSNPGIGLQVSAFAGHDGGTSCPGEGNWVSVEEEENVTVCFEIVNIGDTPLAGIQLTDSVLEIELGDLIVVWGDPSGSLEPGQSLVLAHEMKLERYLRTQTRVNAEPVDQDGNRVEGREVAGTVVMTLDAEDPGGLPGFQDGLDASWEALKWVGGLFVLAAGLIPLLIPLALLVWLWIWWSRRQSSRPKAAPPWTGTASPERAEVAEESAEQAVEDSVDDSEE